MLVSQSFRFLPKFLKYCVLFLFLVQVRSWPLAWHCESLFAVPAYATLTRLVRRSPLRPLPPVYVWRPVFVLRGKYYLHRLSLLFASPSVRKQRNAQWLEQLSPIGRNPLEFQVTYKTWAGESCSLGTS